jgi:hypothetical protein
MTKTVRQRKEELHQTLKDRKNGPFVSADRPQLYDAYRKILYDNGIKNEKVIEIHLKRMLDAQLPKTVVYSNLKFLSLIRSRMAEEGIPLADAEKIMTVIDFNMAEIPEDDDWIGTYALEYAEILKLQYDALFNKGVPKYDYNAQFHDGNVDLLKHFNVMNVQLPAA